MATEMTSNGESGSVLDPKLWGELQNYVDLENIYAKLPFQEFFRLRLVCKEWNRLATDREFLESSFSTPMAKPYFVVMSECWGMLHGLLSYDASAKSWNWTRLPPLDFRSGVLSVDGLIYSRNYRKESEQDVLNLHTRVSHRLPVGAEVTSSNGPFIGLRVDTSVTPYAFQVVLGSSDVRTQIYDSKTNTWELKSSNHPEMEPGRASCAECNGFIYIRSELDEMVTYDLKNDVWGVMDPPPGNFDDYLRSIGAWQDRLFDVTVNPRERSITAWELTDHSKQEWTAFERMPGNLYSWLTYEDNPDPSVDEYQREIHTFFCSEYVLVYTWLTEEGVAERFVMCNLDTKAWEKVEMMSNGESGSVLDPKLWGELQNHVDLKHIYAKLPFQEFFRLRLVCKEWNRLATDREFLESSFSTPMAKPYFVVMSECWDILHGLLSYDASAKRWNWTRLPPLDSTDGFLSVDGLIHSRKYTKVGEQDVLNLHTRVRHRLPVAAERTLNADPFIGLRVDTSVTPYAFQVVLGSSDVHNQIYDSKTSSWELKSPNHPELEPGRASCAESNGFIYIRSEMGMFTYDLKNDVWGDMVTPPGYCDDYLRSIGAWQDRLFDVTVNPGERSITAWELTDHSKQEWTAFERMPGNLYSWLTYEDNPDPPVDKYARDIHTFFCSEYVLVYTWLTEEGVAERFVMCNLDTKAWEKVEVPFGAISLLKQCELK